MKTWIQLFVGTVNAGAYHTVSTERFNEGGRILGLIACSNESVHANPRLTLFLSRDTSTPSVSGYTLPGRRILPGEESPCDYIAVHAGMAYSVLELDVEIERGECIRGILHNAGGSAKTFWVLVLVEKYV